MATLRCTQRTGFRYLFLSNMILLFGAAMFIGAEEITADGDLPPCDAASTSLSGECQSQPRSRCPIDSVEVGTVCIDKYEASVWYTTDPIDVQKIKSGQIEWSGDLSASAVQHGVKGDDFEPGCPDDADGCTDFYAVSVSGVFPADTITWFQAAATCRNSGKRLATNQEWQMAAFGTPDSGVDDGATLCRVSGSSTIETGTRSACVSDTGAYDMVGNLWEWVGEWWPAVIANDGSLCSSGWGSFSDDYNCAAINVTTDGPSALLRGGDAWVSGGNIRSGPLAIAATVPPQIERSNVGFRCARNK